MKESQPIPAIAVSLATSLVAAPYLLIRNDYHKKVAPISKGAYALHSLPLNDEAGSGRRDLNPQPQPWQGYALPIKLFPPATVVAKHY